MDNIFYHQPVMVNEVSNYLITEKDGYYIDCTFGGGGHSLYLLEKYKNIKIIAFDQDGDSFNRFNSNNNLQKFKDKIIFCKDNFRNILKILSNIKIDKVNGLFADLGVSSKQLDDMARGFSFKSDEILDMRMDQSQKITAYDIVNTFSKEKLQDIFFKYGEEPFARQIADKIVDYRIKGSIKTCNQLSDIVCSVKWVKGKINPSTKIFQALRIYVNDELASLQEMLDSIPKILSKNARAVILTYHSLEDRIVKQSFKSFQIQGFKIINKKIITAGEDEIKNNPRSRSAKMRVVEQQK
ncbi:MAG: 16S rRNA (cytosine(1402)-N(4))-methyltransferase RsmH [Endomicrobiaceae bacterium]|nr:16S rRNA (cytosine(1402)-N(4))-methyltransferase RsmH [Endomicrobiaceae bacterium]MDD5101509.1 16S rRNA (cytosine(1402)-N(4))-methyltransferase RsmH [Endomicrobiaceae bacterium]